MVTKNDENACCGKTATHRREAMARWILVAFAIALGSSAQALPLAPPQQPDEVIIKVREACAALRVALASELPPDVAPAGALVD
jgi:hypothetical protein